MAYLGLMMRGRISIMIKAAACRPGRRHRLGHGRLLNRRSKGHGLEIRNLVKQKDNFGVPLPQDIVEIPSWHVETQLDLRQLKNKEHLLFPGAKGAVFRSMSSLAKPFAKVAEAIGVELEFTAWVASNDKAVGEALGGTDFDGDQVSAGESKARQRTSWCSLEAWMAVNFRTSPSVRGFRMLANTLCQRSRMARRGPERGTAGSGDRGCDLGVSLRYDQPPADGEHAGLEADVTPA
jgi:hypothetical protein